MHFLLGSLVLVLAPHLVFAQFMCVLGRDCALSVLDFDIPVTPSVRVSDDSCGSTSGSAVFSFVGPPDVIFEIGVLSNPALTALSLHICLALPDVSDVHFSVDWGTLEVIGPSPTSETVCYFGSECRPVIYGNQLGQIRSLVFFVEESSSCLDGPSGPIYGLSNDPGGWVVASSDPTQASYSNLGIVDPTLSANTPLNLCWTTYLAGTLPLPISLGVLLLTGPTNHAADFSCTLGGPACIIASSDANANTVDASIIISDSGCEIFSSSLVWGGTLAVIPFTTAFAMGIPSAVSGVLAEQAFVCWMHDDAAPLPRVLIGFFTMYGPTSDDNEAICFAGISCTVPIAGVFETATTSSLVVRDTNCASTDANLGSVGVDNLSTNLVGATNVLSINYQFTPGVGIASSPLVLCWEHSTSVVPIATGSFAIVGPVTLGTTLECDLSSSCPISVGLTLPTNVDPLYLEVQQLTLIESASVLEDPCLALANAPSTVVVDSVSDLASYDPIAQITSFVFQIINTAFNSSAPTVVRSVCWTVPNITDSRPVFLGLWQPIGPYSGMAASCTFGSPCSISINPYPEYDPANLFFLTNDDSDCISSRYLNNNLVPLTGTASNPATYVSGVSFSFGSPTGWTDLPPAGTRTMTICYSKSNMYRRCSPLGTLTLS